MTQTATIEGVNYIYLDGGSYGGIFIDPHRKHVVKVFRRSHDFQHSKQVFENEVGAYRRLEGVTELELITPNFFGPVVVEMIRDSKRGDISNAYFCELAFKLAFLPGHFVKIGTVPSPESDRVKDLFYRQRIFHLLDASVSLENDQIVAVIDFSLREVEQWTA